MTGKTDEPKTYGVFERDGVVREANTAEERVKFSFDGWTEREPKDAKKS